MLRIFRHYVSGLSLVLLAGDVLIVLGAFYVHTLAGSWVGSGHLGPKLLLVICATTLMLHLGDLYNTRLPLGRREVFARLLTCQAAAFLLVAAAGFAVPPLRLGRAAFFQVAALSTLALVGWRMMWLGSWSHRRMRIRVLVLGSGAIAKIIGELERTGVRPFEIIGFLDDNPAAPDTIPAGRVLLGKIKDLSTIVEERAPDVVVVAQINRRGNFPAKALLDCRLRGIAVEDWPTFYEKETGKILVTDLRPSWLIFSDGFVKTPRTEIIKRLLDISLAFAALTVALPVMAVVALGIKLDSAGPVLFRQPRLGRNGSVFILRKFRSMRSGRREGPGPVWAQERRSAGDRVEPCSAAPGSTSCRSW